jgi:hypothetical protein
MKSSVLGEQSMKSSFWICFWLMCILSSMWDVEKEIHMLTTAYTAAHVVVLK